MTLLGFVQRWFPLGGGPDREIREVFGLSPRQFFTRIHHLLDTEPPACLSTHPIAEFKAIAIARRRRWLAA